MEVEAHIRTNGCGNVLKSSDDRMRNSDSANARPCGTPIWTKAELRPQAFIET
ncbi:hypothetical protein J6590_064877 [Homalodisca vitripennis]|nr:hypothetical protein J6590_064877 [Homalodisca vitripennis]